jgi:hypothetical protein
MEKHSLKVGNALGKGNIEKTKKITELSIEFILRQPGLSLRLS